MSTSRPWYDDPTNPPPFSLFKKIRSNNSKAPPHRSLAFFPWTKDSLQTLWRGAQHSQDLLPEWIEIINEFSDAVAVGSSDKMYIFFTRQPKSPICINLPPDEEKSKTLPTDCMNVAWTLNPSAPLEPLVIFSRSNVLYIYNPKRLGISSYLRGHGGAITSIAVHPIATNLFCTTSRDYSTRIYDLALSPQTTLVNPCWPPGTEDSRAGAAHGLHMTEGEGIGIGRCIMVLMGGRSGGHQAAVLGAAFHSHLPLIATCGLDRLVKIWFVPPASSEVLTREDKPLFSSSRVHKARVASISWLQHDLLLTHSAPALMRVDPNNKETRETYLESGQLTIWRWLGMDRFFPPDKGDVRQSMLRGCASDYQESASFKIIATHSFPSVPEQTVTPNLHVCHSDQGAIVLFTYPNTTKITLVNIAHLLPRTPPPFPFDDTELVESARRMNLEGPPSNDSVKKAIVPQILGWEIRTTSSIQDNENESDMLMACAMGMSGETVIGIGAKGTMWVWNKCQGL